MVPWLSFLIPQISILKRELQAGHSVAIPALGRQAGEHKASLVYTVELQASQGYSETLSEKEGGGGNNDLLEFPTPRVAKKFQ